MELLKVNQVYFNQRNEYRIQITDFQKNVQSVYSFLEGACSQIFKKIITGKNIFL